MRTLLIGAALAALASGSAYAGPGNGHGNGGGGGGHGGGPPAAAGGGGQHGGGNPGHADKGPSMKADRGPAMKADRGPAMKVDRGPAMKADRGPAMKADRSPSMKGAAMKPDRGPQARAEKPMRGPDQARPDRARPDKSQGANRGPAMGPDRGPASTRGGDRYAVRTDDRAGNWYTQRRDVIAGCPPGLARKNNGCTPPGLARQRDEAYRQAYYRPQWFGYNSLGDGRYYYDDGYLYRTNAGGSVLGYIPLLGGALSVGNQWPSYYQPVSVPDYYVNYYNLGPDNSYRYADDVLYRVDPNTSAITSIAALLTGDQFGVGQRMPSGYDVYNVPYGYQDRYVDGPDSYYRYADGYVYQVDPTTQLIQAAIQLLT